jgi:hypothetical protein
MMRRFLVIAMMAVLGLAAEVAGLDTIGSAQAQKQYFGIKGGWGEGDVRLYPHWTCHPFGASGTVDSIGFTMVVARTTTTSTTTFRAVCASSWSLFRGDFSMPLWTAIPSVTPMADTSTPLWYR